MKILLTTGLLPADIGGPAQYAPNLAKEFEAIGHKVRVQAYKVEHQLPTGIRHLYFFFKILPSVAWANSIITLDTFSVGFPSLVAAKIFRKKIIVRIGGDFLWEQYVERTDEMITLPEFYGSTPRNLNQKERIIKKFTQNLVNGADILVFNTEWQKNIWKKAYGISDGKMRIIRNVIPAKNGTFAPSNRNFLWAGRKIKIKNLSVLDEIFNEVKQDIPEADLEIISNLSHQELARKIKECYAVILPSLSDVCPNFILEATSFNRPFIMTKETGVREIYPKGGIFVDPHSKEDIKMAVVEMLRSEVYNQHVRSLESLNPSHTWKEIAQEFVANI